MTDPWWRVRVTQEINDWIANFQSLYKRAKRSFRDGPSSSSDEPCHTARQGPKHQSAVESEASRYLPKVDTPATGRGNSFDVSSRRGGSTSFPRGSVGRRAHPPKTVEEGGTGSPTGSHSLSDYLYQLESGMHELLHDLEYDRNIRLNLQDLINSSPLIARRINFGLPFLCLRTSARSVRFATS